MIKILIGGSPCTRWSIAQKNNREIKPEGWGWELFKNFLIAIEKFKPDFFLYENNKSAAQAIKDQISRELGVDLMYINSALVSAQNRQRFYAFNWEVEQPQDRGILLKDILESGEPWREKSYCLDANYYKGGNLTSFNKQSGQRLMFAEPIGTTKDDKAKTLKAQYYKNGVANFITNGGFGATAVAEPICHTIQQQVKVRKYTCDIEKLKATLRDAKTMSCKELAEKLNRPKTEVEHWFRTDNCFSVPDADVWFDLKKLLNITTTEFDDFVTVFEIKDGVFEKANRCYDVNGKMSTLMTSNNDKIIEPICLNSKSGRGGVEGLQPSLQDRIYSIDGKATAVTTAFMPKIAEPIRVGTLPNKNGELKDHQHSRIYSVEGKSTNLNANGGGQGAKTGLYAVPTDLKNCYEVKDGFITIKGKQYPIKLADGFYIIRKLTVKECCRLQTMPDDYFVKSGVSNSRAYCGLGNGWTAEIIIHILQGALKDVPKDEEIVVLSMYDGIGTGRYCLDKMGFTNVKYYAYEIDKYAMKVANSNYPDIIQCGDAFDVRKEDWSIENEK